MIDFELSAGTKMTKKLIHSFVESSFRSVSREFDEKEHTDPAELISSVHQLMKGGGMTGMASSAGSDETDAKKGSKPKKPKEANLQGVILAEELFWGDAGLALAMPGPGLGGAAVLSTGTAEQKERIMKRFSEDKPAYGAMAITEPGCGSDTSAITTTATLDNKTNEWILNGEKIFVSMGKRATEIYDGFVVVWATLDRKAGRAGIKPFIVEKGTPGMKVTKLEHKMGIRASDTAAMVFEDCRIPHNNILGSAEVAVDKGKTEGFKGVMKTFDATRPFVAAMAIGVARAAYDMVREILDKEGVRIRYGAPVDQLTVLERDVLEMEVSLKAARLLLWRAAGMLDKGERNNLEASMAKAKAGMVGTKVTQKAVEILGPLGYSRKILLEKFMRDAKINDIFEGTGQIQLLVIARNILGYTRKELK
ncbi:MAG: acyl-CoA dehydrogenase family protein [bacterium]|nr:acyl-CoA dehydrogenase family protein [bacterium]